MKVRSYIFAVVLALASMTACKRNTIETDITISKDVLMDKIKGGWLGKAIGCTYGGPTEFKYCGTMINENIEFRPNPHGDSFIACYRNFKIAEFSNSTGQLLNRKISRL